MPEGGDPEDLEALTAAFRIESHFAELCEYRPTPDTDCLIDCYDDPLWMERPMMRVDWYEDLAANAAVLGIGPEESFEIEPMAIYDYGPSEGMRDPASLVLENFSTTTTYVFTGQPNQCAHPQDGVCSALVVMRHVFVRGEE